MATAPTVRDLNTLVSELEVGIKPQRDHIGTLIEQNQQFGDAQVQGMNAAQTRAFKTIEGRSQDRGALFSGFSPDAQAEYTADTYLPALAALQQQIASTRGQLMGQSIALGTDVFNRAFDAREGDMDKSFNWNMQEDNQEFTAGQNDLDRRLQKEMQEDQQAFQKVEAEIQRAFDAGENQKARDLQLKLENMKIASSEKMAAMQASASRYSADRSYAASTSGGYKMTDNDRVSAVNGFFDAKGANVKGWDGRVSPATFQEGRQAFIANGGTGADYNAAFRGYADVQGQGGSDGRGNYTWADYGL